MNDKNLPATSRRVNVTLISNTGSPITFECHIGYYEFLKRAVESVDAVGNSYFRPKIVRIFAYCVDNVDIGTLLEFTPETLQYVAATHEIPQ
jgi:hypothetical protein